MKRRCQCPARRPPLEHARLLEELLAVWAQLAHAMAAAFLLPIRRDVFIVEQVDVSERRGAAYVYAATCALCSTKYAQSVPRTTVSGLDQAQPWSTLWWGNHFFPATPLKVTMRPSPS